MPKCVLYSEASQASLSKVHRSHLNLLHSEVQERLVAAHRDEALRPHAAHACPQAPIQLQHHQLVQQPAYVGLGGGFDGGVGEDGVIKEGLDFLPDDAVPGLSLVEELFKQSPKASQVGFQLLRKKKKVRGQIGQRPLK